MTFRKLSRLIRLLTWKESDKGGAMGELCRIVRHLGSGIVWGAPLTLPRQSSRSQQLARVLVRLDHIASFIVNANHINKCEHSLHYSRVLWETT
jgi:hypothetical protein